MMHNGMYYPQSNDQESCYDYEYYGAATTDPYSFNNYNSTTSSSNSSYVDCTLSLGTTSTRSDTGNERSKKQSSKRSGSRVSNFCWDLLQQTTTSSSSKLSKAGRVASGGGSGSGGDPLVARRCASCDTTSTPLWRNGPKGPKSLCNACGIRYKKEERRANAAASANSNMSGASAMESQYGSGEHYYSNNSYTHNYNHHQAQKMNCLFPAATNEYRYMESDDTSHYEHAGNGGVSFLPWMMNVADRPSLVHDFTR